MKRLTTKEFIKKSIKVHGNKYDYSLVEYKNNITKVKIICKLHKDTFNQLPSNHLRGQGCPKCRHIRSADKRKLTIDKFIEMANKVHGNKYDYSLVKYNGYYIKVEIVCPIHGIFEQKPTNHLHGSGCQKCSSLMKLQKQSLTVSQFIKKSIKVHGNKYDYSLVEYKNNITKVKIICPEHGIFEQRPDKHLIGNECKKCGYIKISNSKFSKIEEVINKAKEIHGNKYDYSLVDYKGVHVNIKIICPVHGVFEQTPDNHLHGSGCQRCSHHISKPELEICSFLEELNIDYKQSDRSIIKPYELDIVIPSKNIAIEFNGIYWHSEQMLKSRNVNPIRYHQQKYLGCKKEGYQLLSILEPEWIQKKDIIKSIICAKLNIYSEKIHGRKCEIKQLVASEARHFFNENHIQGFSNGSIHLGLFFKNQLVSCISFRKNKDSFELTRFVNKKNTLVHGAFSKLLKYFIKNNSFESIYTFADLRYFEGNVYEKNGFKFVHKVAPSYYYFKGKSDLLHKRGFQHKYLERNFNNYDSTLTEYQNCLNHGYDRIWDCGKLKFEYR